MSLLILLVLLLSAITAIADDAAVVAVTAIIAVTSIAASVTIITAAAVELILLKFFMPCTLNQSPEERLNMPVSNYLTFWYTS